MCGIVGAINFKDSSFEISESYIVEMRDTMIHRGPDAGGVWVSSNKNIGIGHRRLSIIDLGDFSSQPMFNEAESLCLAFNGEIYNHSEIRKELEATGNYKWKTDHSDTEVVLHAFEEWGLDFIDRLRGMFAIALYDTLKGELLLIRDRIGIKPLYYSIHNGRLTFASEIKALLKDPLQIRKVNEDAFFDYLSFLTVPAPFTLFEGIKKIPGGCWLKINHNGEIIENRYYDILDNVQPLEKISEKEIAERVLIELRKSVQLRKVSDVPVGLFLSGGIDSSVNTALFSEGEDKPVNAFTIGYDKVYETVKSETEYAKFMANEVKANYFEKLLDSDDFLDFLPLMIKLQDEPIADPVCVPVYYVSKLAKENGITVCQVGEGADELFWGYQSWKTSLYLQKISDLFPIPFVKKIAVKLLSPFPKINNSFQMEYLKRASNSKPIFWGGAESFTSEQKKTLLSPRLRKKFKNKSSWDSIKHIYDRFKQKAWEKSNLAWMTYLDLNLRLPELLLMRVDKMSMGVSLEGRVPFLDHKFVELAMSIPEKIKTKDGILKNILKKSVREIIPDTIIDRKKQGFDIPIHEWFLGGYGDVARKELISFCDETDFFDKNAIMKLLDKGNGRQIWFILNFVLWWKEYIK